MSGLPQERIDAGPGTCADRVAASIGHFYIADLVAGVGGSGNRFAILEPLEWRCVAGRGGEGDVAPIHEGGSGRLQWDVQPGHSELDVHGALGRGAWHLQVGPAGALLQLADGTEQSAPRVGELIQEHIGWPIPLDALQWWVRGLPAPGVVENQTLGQEGLLLSLRQFGWSVKFTRYDSFGGMEMPVRLDANRDNYRVKLVISQWRLGVGDANSD